MIGEDMYNIKKKLAIAVFKSTNNPKSVIEVISWATTTERISKMIEYIKNNNPSSEMITIKIGRIIAEELSQKNEE